MLLLLKLNLLEFEGSLMITDSPIEIAKYDHKRVFDGTGLLPHLNLDRILRFVPKLCTLSYHVLIICNESFQSIGSLIHLLLDSLQSLRNGL